jgi:hypothetical protein
MDNAEKLARGGVHISPRLPDGKNLSLIIRFAFKHQAAMPVAYERLQAYDKNLTVQDPTFEGLIYRYTLSGGLKALDYAAIILALTNLDVEQCMELDISAADRMRIEVAIYQYLPRKNDFTADELKKLNSAETAKEVQKSFLEICLNWQRSTIYQTPLNYHGPSLN